MDDKYVKLEKRAETLEKMLKVFLQSDENEIHLQIDHCQGD